LKILKLFVRELSNIAEGEVIGEGERPGTASTEDGDEWESGDDEDGWEDLGESRDSDDKSVDGQKDLLKGVDTKVHVLKLD
jgi:hypothetical protein